MRGLELVSRKRNLHRVQNGRDHGEHEKNRTEEAAKEVAVLAVHLLEVELAKKQRGIEVKPRQPQLAVAVSFRHSGIFDTTKIRDKPAERWPVHVLEDKTELLLLGDAEVGFVLNEVSIGAQKASCSLVDVALTVVLLVRALS